MMTIAAEPTLSSPALPLPLLQVLTSLRLDRLKTIRASRWEACENHGRGENVWVLPIEIIG